MHARVGLGLDRTQGPGAPGHRAGMPMLEQTPGGQDDRVVLVGQLCGQRKLGRDQLTAATREGFAVQHDRAVAALGIGAGPELAVGFEMLVGEPAVVFGQRAKLCKYILDGAELKARCTHSPADLGSDLPVLASLSGQLQCRPADLHPTIGIGEGAELLKKR